jgi:hypothetical protein
VAVIIRRLEEQDKVESFDCGDEPLNNYLKRHAWTNQQKSSIGVTYVAIDEGAPFSAIGYFTLATASRRSVITTGAFDIELATKTVSFSSCGGTRNNLVEYLTR